MLARLDALYPYDRPRLEALFEEARRRDLRGEHLHLLFGMVWCFFSTWTTSFVELAGAPLVVFFLLRLPYTWRLVPALFAQPVVVLVLAWGAWQATTILWSPDPTNGLEELGANRWAWCLLVLWPIIRWRRWLIAAFALGFVAGHATQVLHGIGTALEIDWLGWDRMPHRNPGWWRPVISGSILCGALGLHLPAALMGRGWWRWAGLVGSLVTLLGIAATGTRGAWIAAAGLLAIVGAVAAVRLRRRGRMLRALLGALAIAAVAAGAAWWAVGPSMAERARRGYDEVVRALEEGRFRTDTGARLLMGWWAIEAFMERPVTGIGAGGYAAWVERHLERQGIDPSERSIHAHAHNGPLHIAATTGLVGLALAGAIAVVGLRGAFKGLPAPGIEGYDAGPGFALVGLLLVSAFDPVHLNVQTAAHLAIMLSLCLWPRPRTDGP